MPPTTTITDNITLPATPSFLTGLLRELSTISPDDSLPARPQTAKDSHPTLPESARPAILTLHTTYPHLLLDALDLLDRGLLVRILRPSNPPPAPSHPQTSHSAREAAPPATQAQVGNAIDHVDDNAGEANHATTAFYVAHSLSTQREHQAQSQSRRQKQSHVVHLPAWHCTCPAFAYAAFIPASPPVRTTPAPGDPEHSTGHGVRRRGSPYFGGIPALKDVVAGGGAIPPACKHLLAAALGEAAPRLFMRKGREGQGFGEAVVGSGDGEGVAGVAVGGSLGAG